ncbi:MAG: 3'-5' exonuclease [Synechococcus sp.]|nr:3'-5' exonuclease [Synechococcus sp.]
MADQPQSPWEQTSLLNLVDEPATRPEAERPAALQPEPEPPPEPIATPEPAPQEPDAEPAAAAVIDQLLIIDTETTGLDAATDQVLEVGAILYSLPQRSVLAQVSFLLPADVNAAEPLNGIPVAATQAPQPWRQSLELLQALAAHAQLAVAHNAAFDQQWFGQGLLPDLGLPWLCSMEQISWPAERQLRARPSVRDLALAYGVPVWAAHRALTDCIYLAQVFERCADLPQRIQEGLEPRLLYRAQVSYNERHLAREAGFRWNEPVQGAWTRQLSERQLQAMALPFSVVPVAS